MSLNKVMLIGRLAADPDCVSRGGYMITTFGLITENRYKKDGQWIKKTELHRCKCFGKVAEITANWLHKGSRIYVEGKMQTNKWEKDGVTHWTTEVVFSQNPTFLDTKKQDDMPQIPESQVKDEPNYGTYSEEEDEYPF